MSLQQQDLGDAIEHVGPRRQPGIRGVLGQDPLAEAVEVGDRHAGAGGRADGRSSRSCSSRAAFTL